MPHRLHPITGARPQRHCLLRSCQERHGVAVYSDQRRCQPSGLPPSLAQLSCHCAQLQTASKLCPSVSSMSTVMLLLVPRLSLCTAELLSVAYILVHTSPARSISSAHVAITLTEALIEVLCVLCTVRSILCNEAAGGEVLAARSDRAARRLEPIHSLHQRAVDILPLQDSSVQKVQKTQG